MKTGSRWQIAALHLLIAFVALTTSGVHAQQPGFLRFDLPTDTVRILGNTVFPTVDFTYEMRIRVRAGALWGLVINEQRDSVEDKGLGVSSSSFVGSMTRGYLCGDLNQAAIPWLGPAWRHLAWQRSGNVVRLFIDGMLVSEWTSQATCAGNFPDSLMTLGMMRHAYACTQFPSFRGDLDWIRVSRIARYSGSFAPPRECDIQSDPDTLLLLRFNDAPGSAELLEESANRIVCRRGEVACGGPATAPLLMAMGSDPCGCIGDISRDGFVNGIDLGRMLGEWGASGAESPSDLDGDGSVDGIDLGLLLSHWGACAVRVPAWATLIEAVPDPAVVTDPVLRQAVVSSGWAWRVRDDSTQLEMLLVPPGSFQMGCSPSLQHACNAEEFPVHGVTLTSAFYLGRFEVTQAQWTARMGSNPSHFQGVSYPDASNRPVETVSWIAVQAFLAPGGLRLPTEAEWEYACRAGTTSAFNNGSSDDALVPLLAWFEHSSNGQTNPVGQKIANPLGLHDMHGNVWEWVSDWYSPSFYSESPPQNPTGPVVGSERVARGGSWIYGTSACRSSLRARAAEATADFTLGFRVARNP